MKSALICSISGIYSGVQRACIRFENNGLVLKPNCLLHNISYFSHSPLISCQLWFLKHQECPDVCKQLFKKSLKITFMVKCKRSKIHIKKHKMFLCVKSMNGGKLTTGLFKLQPLFTCHEYNCVSSVEWLLWSFNTMSTLMVENRTSNFYSQCQFMAKFSRWWVMTRSLKYLGERESVSMQSIGEN